MKIKTEELTGEALNCAVAIAEGWAATKAEDMCGEYVWLVKGDSNQDLRSYRPSSNWMQGGPIIEREKIATYPHINRWVARRGVAEHYGSTPLEAAMRCYVASKLGDEIELPEDLA